MINVLAVAAVVGAPDGFAGRLTGMLWTAYGKPIKFVAVVALVMLVGLPIAMWLKRVMS